MRKISSKNSQKFARISEDKQADGQRDEHIRQINRQFVIFGSLTVKQTFRQKKNRQTDWQACRQAEGLID